MIHRAPSRPYLIGLLAAYLDEADDLVGYLEWAEPVIEETGAMFYTMHVCHNSSSWYQHRCIDE
jgi:hypothetical protein